MTCIILFTVKQKLGLNWYHRRRVWIGVWNHSRWTIHAWGLYQNGEPWVFWRGKDTPKLLRHHYRPEFLDSSIQIPLFSLPSLPNSQIQTTTNRLSQATRVLDRFVVIVNWKYHCFCQHRTHYHSLLYATTSILYYTFLRWSIHFRMVYDPYMCLYFIIF